MNFSVALLCIFTTLFHCGNCQIVSLKKSSLGTSISGQANTTKSIRINAIIGQPSPVTQIRSNSLNLLQGFQTPIASFKASSQVKEVSIYPNPSFGKLTISWSGDVPDEPLTVELTALSGKIIETLKADRSSQRLSLDFSHVAAGVYTIRIHGSRSGLANFKVFIQ
jgi:hypothetical protein